MKIQRKKTLLSSLSLIIYRATSDIVILQVKYSCSSYYVSAKKVLGRLTYLEPRQTCGSRLNWAFPSWALVH